MSILSKNTKFLVCALWLFSTFTVNATVVEIQTSFGNVEVNLYDNATPATVENFLSYVNSGAFASNVMHRSVDGFIVQAGGYQYTGPITGSFNLDRVATGQTVINEPKFSNIRGTIAMAKLGGQVNSATSGWFINLDNNSENLDVQNGGFTVFGEVIGDGMQVIDAIAALGRMNAGGAFSELPIRDYTQSDLDNNEPITDEHLVVIVDVIVKDSTVDSAAGLNPKANTLINGSGSNNDSGGSGVGSISCMLLWGLCLFKRRIYF